VLDLLWMEQSVDGLIGGKQARQGDHGDDEQGLHARTDGFTSLAVLLGAGGVALGLPWADPVVGLLITVAVLGVLRSAVKQVGARLMDAIDPTIVDQATTAITSVEGVRQIRELRIRWIGHTLRAEVDITADPTLSITQAHDLALTPKRTCSPMCVASPPPRCTSAPLACTTASRLK
jgi:cation diffusion facilitator family transporter